MLLQPVVYVSQDHEIGYVNNVLGEEYERTLFIDPAAGPSQFAEYLEWCESQHGAPSPALDGPDDLDAIIGYKH